MGYNTTVVIMNDALSSIESDVPILVGGNLGLKIEGVWVERQSKEPELRLLEALASKLGYSLRKKSAK